MITAVSKNKIVKEPIDTWIVVLYLVPIVGYFLLSWAFGGSPNWALTVFGLMFAIFGSATLLLSVRSWQGSVMGRRSAPKGSSEVQQGMGESDLQLELTDFRQKVACLEAEIGELRRERGADLEELELLREHHGEYDQRMQTTLNTVDEKQNLVEEYQRTIAEQREVIGQNRQYISQLENKVQDLSYEVKTLLQLGDLNAETGQVAKPRHPVVDLFTDGALQATPSMESTSDRRVQSPYDARMQLEKCLEKAHKLKGSSHLSSKDPRFRDLQAGSYALDYRRLFDAYRNETSSVILMYSRKEKKLLFANNQVKALTGWSPEKFVKDFHQLVQKGKSDWDAAIRETENGSRAELRLLLKTRASKEVLAHCYLGSISEGLFTGNAVAVLYPSGS